MITKNLSELDRNFEIPEVADGLVWHDVRGLLIEGKGWTDTESPFDRLPARAQAIVRPAVWALSQHSAGLVVRFITDATEISARWTVTSPSLAMSHMTATGVSGLDLYAWDADRWRWAGSGRPDKPDTTRQSVPLTTGLRAGEKVFQLYLPLYNGTQQLQIGIPEINTIRSAPRPADQSQPICFYGTSIVQGGCASRPGMAYTAILGRQLNRPVINLGFSGNGPMDLELAPLLAELDPAVYVLDPLPNMTPERIVARAQKFVEIIRESRPKTPIILVESIVYQRSPLLDPAQRSHEFKNIALREVFKTLQSAGHDKLWLVPGDTLLGDDGDATVDGTHPTDVGFKRMAEAIEPTLREALGE